MLIEQLQTLRTLLADRKKRLNERKTLESLESYQKQLDDLLCKWQTLVQVAPRLGFDKAYIQQFQTDVQTIARRFEQGTSLQSSDVSQIRQVVDTLEINLKDRWNQRKNTLVDPLLQARAHIALAIGGQTAKATLSQPYRIIIQILDSPLPSAADLNSLTQAIMRMEKEVQSALPDMSPTVQEFLEKLSSDQATYNDLAPEIVIWCREHHLLDRISLRFEGGLI